jgi:hypothetical protein
VAELRHDVEEEAIPAAAFAPARSRHDHRSAEVSDREFRGWSNARTTLR